MCIVLHQFANHENHLRHIHPVRHAKHPKQILRTKHIYNKIKRTTIWFCGGRGGGGSGSFCWVKIFISNLLRATIFIFIQLQHRPFILRHSLFESDGCSIIYFPRDPGQNIYIKVFNGQDIYFKPAAHPLPLRINCSSPNKKGTSFYHSRIEPAAIQNT